MTGDTARTSEGPQSPADHAVRYEALRAYVVQRHAPASRDGLVVLLRQGVAAWMSAWASLPAAPPVAHTERWTLSPLPDATSAEIVRVLAAMTLGHIREVHA